MRRTVTIAHLLTVAWSDGDTGVMVYTDDGWVVVERWHEPWMRKQVEEMEEERRRQKESDAGAF